jgi:hypothetical protein
MKSKMLTLSTLLVCLTLTLLACGPKPEPAAPEAPPAVSTPAPAAEAAASAETPAPVEALAPVTPMMPAQPSEAAPVAAPNPPAAMVTTTAPENAMGDVAPSTGTAAE